MFCILIGENYLPLLFEIFCATKLNINYNACIQHETLLFCILLLSIDSFNSTL